MEMAERHATTTTTTELSHTNGREEREGEAAKGEEY